MKAHYTEVDLLETYYTQPGESMPVMMHLASCDECATRYQRLDRKLREAAVCHPSRGEGFWAAQRDAILSRTRGSSSRPLVRLLPVAAALLIAIVAGGLIFDRLQPSPTPVAVAPALEAAAVPTDPWQSDELQEFGAVVDWETWLATPETDQSNGGRSS